MKKINVLVFPCGSENAIEIHNALKNSINIEVFGASGKEDHGSFVFKNYINNLPYITEPCFLNSFNEVIEKNNIDVIFPTHDSVSLFLAKHASNIKAKIAVSGLEQALICRFKDKTYELFNGQDFNPLIYSSPEQIDCYPVFVKPIVGEGSKNTKIIYHPNDELFTQEWKKDFIVMEYLPGEELTVDCFTDRYGILRFIGPRKRNRIFGGISVNSSIMPLTDEIKKVSEVINNTLKFRGLWFLQVKQDKLGNYKLMEVSVRASGTMSLYRNLGVNFPLLTVYDLLEVDVDILTNDFYVEVDKALFSRYKTNLQYQIIYIDFDDTITKNKKVNPFVIMYLLTERNKGKTIKVVTRHEYDFELSLNKLGIHKDLFAEIIHISWNEKKYHYISEKEGVIFIDNSFAERKEVRENLHIPVFDVDAIQCLIDWHE